MRTFDKGSEVETERGDALSKELLRMGLMVVEPCWTALAARAS